MKVFKFILVALLSVQTLAQGTADVMTFKGTADVRIEYENSNRSRKSHHVTIKVADRATVNGHKESNPFMMWIKTDQIFSEGSFGLETSSIVYHPEVGMVVAEYWDFDMDGENLMGFLKEDYKEAAAIGNSVFAVDDQSAWATGMGIWPFFVHEGATMEGTIGLSGVDLTVKGYGSWGPPISFEIHIQSTEQVDLSKYMGA